MSPSTICFRLSIATIILGLLYSFSLLIGVAISLQYLGLFVLFAAVFMILAGFCAVFERD